MYLAILKHSAVTVLFHIKVIVPGRELSSYQPVNFISVFSAYLYNLTSTVLLDIPLFVCMSNLFFIQRKIVYVIDN